MDKIGFFNSIILGQNLSDLHCSQYFLYIHAFAGTYCIKNAIHKTLTT